MMRNSYAGLALLAAAAMLGPPAVWAKEKAPPINPPAPYKLFVAGVPESGEGAAREVVKIFDARNAGKKWRSDYDVWFTLVPSRGDAEIVLELADAGFEQVPGYQTKYYMKGTVAIPGIVQPITIRGEDWIRGFSGPYEERDLLDRIIRYLRTAHPDHVLNHRGGPAVAAVASRP